MNTRSFTLAALIAGLVTALLSNLPLLNLVNLFLCVWVWIGGFLAVVFYRRFEHGRSTPTPGQGAGLGALTGLIAAFIGAIVFALTSVVSLPLMADAARLLNIQGDLPFQSDTPALPTILASTAVFLVLDLVLYPLFGAISGLIAASLAPRPQPA